MGKVVFDTLTFMSRLEHLKSWFYKKIKPYLGNRILEAGCGTGNLTSYLLDKQLVVAVDNDSEMLDECRKRFSQGQNIRFTKYSLTDPSIIKLSENNLDTIVCINTLEHIEDDAAALKNFRSILVKGGTLILLVPAFQRLFCSLDKAAGHYRRYGMEEISEKAERCGFSVEKKMYFNFFGVIGWFFNGKILKKEKISTRLLWLFDLLVPLLDFFENLIGPPIGLSIILICRKDR
ncbi:MAG: class I SAM-dependent methyltransferase [Candidatus Omnitrophica bacterium]|nr:class I SAM-dependent methyltransferase [Candidatus Omnitrophota bacterium]